VLYYSPKDVPRMLGMIHGDAGENVFWGMVRYGQAHGDDQLCRYTILGTLGETDTSPVGQQRKQELIDQCTTTSRRDVGAHAQTVTRVVDTLLDLNEPCTLNQIVAKCKQQYVRIALSLSHLVLTIRAPSLGRSKGDDSNFRFLKDNPPAKDLTKEGKSLSITEYFVLCDC
jgi:hypothetical protein